jgi:hypothetical protein
VLLGAIAVMVTGVLGYFRARDALEKAVFDQLTTARQTKTRQIRDLLPHHPGRATPARHVQDGGRCSRAFRIAVDQLDRSGTSPDLRQKVSNWYAENFIPAITRVLGREPPLADYLPVGAAPYYLQYHYIVTNPNPKERRKLVDDPGDGSDYSRLHAVYHPLMRAAAATVGFFDLMIADPKSGRLIYTVEKEVDFTTSLQFGPYRSSNVAAAVARCALTPTGRRSVWRISRHTARRAVHQLPSWQRRLSIRVSSSACWSRNCLTRRSTTSSPAVAAGGKKGSATRAGRPSPRRPRLSRALWPARVLRGS